MASKRTRQPLYVYDEPVTYIDFDGGINNDPANNNIRDNELRDAINCSYNNRTLERRLGAKLYKEIKFADPQPGDTRGFVQGQFTLTAGNTYYIVAKDGELYFSQLDVANDLYVMVKLPIVLSEDYFNGTINKLSSKYIISGLEQRNSYHNRHLDQEGYVLEYDQATEVSHDFTTLDDVADVGILVPISHRFIFQNYRLVSGVVFKDELLVATGTRLVRIREEDNALVAELVTPKEINSWDYGNIGFNYLSPYPELHVFDTSTLGTAQIRNILCETHTIFPGDGTTKFNTVMDFIRGTDKDHYWFKWEWKDASVAESDWADLAVFTAGLDEISIDSSGFIPGHYIQIRCTFSTDHFTDGETRTIIDEALATFGATYTTYLVEAGESVDYDPVPAQRFLEIHSCNKILADGNKMILYGTPHNYFVRLKLPKSIRNFSNASPR